MYQFSGIRERTSTRRRMGVLTCPDGCIFNGTKIAARTRRSASLPQRGSSQTKQRRLRQKRARCKPPRRQGVWLPNFLFPFVPRPFRTNPFATVHPCSLSNSVRVGTSNKSLTYRRTISNTWQSFNCGHPINVHRAKCGSREGCNYSYRNISSFKYTRKNSQHI